MSAAVSGQTIEVKGPKGVRSFTASDDVTLAVEEGKVVVSPRGKSKRARQQWGMCRTMGANCVMGVRDGFKKELDIPGVGYVLKCKAMYSSSILACPTMWTMQLRQM